MTYDQWKATNPAHAESDELSSSADDAFEEGYADFMSGRKNPYPPRSPEAEDWESGHRWAEDDNSQFGVGA